MEYVEWRKFTKVIGKAIRDTISKLGGTMPEKLETPKKV